MIQRVLIANRGEIAIRIIRACRTAGLGTVAVYSDADADAPHVLAADAAVRIGPPPPAESYLNVAALLAAAAQTGADPVTASSRSGRISRARSRRPGWCSSARPPSRSRAWGRRPGRDGSWKRQACRSSPARPPTISPTTGSRPPPRHWA
jgi:hypothetical protein